MRERGSERGSSKTPVEKQTHFHGNSVSLTYCTCQSWKYMQCWHLYTHKHTHTHTAPMDTAHVISSTHGNSGEEAASSMQTETGEALFGSATVNKEQLIWQQCSDIQPCAYLHEQTLTRPDPLLHDSFKPNWYIYIDIYLSARLLIKMK